MRTTLTLEPDVEALIKRTMSERGISMKRAVNDAIRAGMLGRSGNGLDLPVHDLGEPLVDVTKALRLAGELEDQELSARLSRGA